MASFRRAATIPLTFNKEIRLGPQHPYCDRVHAEKHRGPGETFKEAMTRVAGALSDNQDHFQEFRDILLDQAFIPGGRVQSAMGSTRGVTAFNCFVSGTIEDSMVDGHASIMQRATDAATTMRMGGGIGYDFSALRPRGSLIRKLESKSAGPVPIMGIFDAICRCIASSGHRRGAQMGVLRVDHPDIEEFIHAKRDSHSLTGFNISVGVTDAFMEAVRDDKPFDLVWGGSTHRTVRARDLWDIIMRSTWEWAEPGILFLDRINGLNNLWYCETIAATNPCGEQPLPPDGACLLGSFNLVKYLLSTGDGYAFDWDRFRRDIPVVVRAMDNVIDRTRYPLFEQEKEAKNKRRMGLGITGAANCIEALGFEYGSTSFCQMLDQIMETLTNCAYAASAELAQEKGPFPLFDAEKYLDGSFIERLNEDTQFLIHKYGIRNSHLISIAPTGTISLTADNVSSGIEPVFAYSVERTVQTFDGPEDIKLEDYGVRYLGIKGCTINDISPEDHIKVLATAQYWTDSAVSKTCNVGDDTSWEAFKDLYMEAWKTGCKGCTTFRSAGSRKGILREDASCQIDPATGARTCDT